MDQSMTPERFAELLAACYKANEERLSRDYQRSLSFQDGMFDRWERARRLGFGERTSIYNSAAVFGDVRIGTDSWIGPNTLLDGSGGGLSIGSFCSISSGVHIYTHDTVLWALSGGALGRAEGPVSIGDCVYVGSQSIIAAGVKIGSRCVIGANSFVNDDVADGTVVGGSPARKLGTVVGESAAVRIVFDSAK
ncbi:acyltransferase [Polaromonas sp. CT11-55]|uniref:acyltransferase n=1 Tax=Polaromonas sp. CT11-55 TaxID=3243045 RepID=UPI0039A51C9B